MKIVIFACFLGFALAVPVYKGITEEEGIPSVGYEVVQVSNERQAGAALLGALGTALVPVVGTVVGPLLNNFATGFVNAITGNLPSAGATGGTTGGTASTSRPNFDAFMINVPGAEGPFMLLTQDLAGAEIPFRSQIPSFNVSPYGKVHIRQPASQKSSLENNEKREETQSETEDY